MKTLFVLFMTDYLLTFMGIKNSLITEGNPLMVWLFGLPFIAGLIVRLLMAVILIYLPIRMIKAGKIRPVLAKAYYGVVYTVNVLILGVHLYWIIGYRLMTVLFPVA